MKRRDYICSDKTHGIHLTMTSSFKLPPGHGRKNAARFPSATVFPGPLALFWGKI
jgi:hypothetical protein